MTAILSQEGVVDVTTRWDKRLRRQDGTAPIRIFVALNGEQRAYTTGQYLTKEDWRRLGNLRCERLDGCRKIVESAFRNVVAVIEEQISGTGRLDFTALSIRLHRKSAGTIKEWFERRIEAQKSAGHWGNARQYESALHSIERWMGRGIAVEQITVKWLLRYEYKQITAGIKLTTIALHASAIRTICNELVALNYFSWSQYPLGRYKYQIRRSRSHKRALTLSQVRSLMEFKDGSEEEIRARDYWLFLYFANGMNIADFIQLKYRNISDGEIRFIRQKTRNTTLNEQEIVVKITPEIRVILQRWSNPPIKDNYLFPTIQHTDNWENNEKEKHQFIAKMNKHLNAIGKKLGIKHLTTFSARHTYATILKRQGASIKYISKSLGHTNITTTRYYLDTFESEDRLRISRILEASLHGKKCL